ncbi:MAG: choice-of-anchor B family protein [Ignavibacteriae bacterium]|nr:choice-of-anchor B family protein [Ignavibacteriota bacterium]
MKKIIYLLLILISVSSASAQLPNNNMYLLSNLNLHPVPSQFNAPWDYAAVWGYVAPDGKEYAILGGTMGTSFYNISDSANIYEVDFFPTNINTSNPDGGVLWKEMKVYSHYAYVVSEADTSGVEIYDLQYLPDTVVFVKKFTAPGHRTTHSISQEGPYLYLNGSNSAFGQGVAVLDLSADPENPVLRGKWNTRYVHDCRVLRDTIYAMNINDGNITVIDARNKDSLKTISQWLNAPNPSPHNCAISSDRRFLFATDEVGGIPRLLKVWNIEDLSNVTQVTTWQPTNITTSVVHNVEVYGNTAVIAHYTAGVRVLDVSNPVAPVEIAWYDTYPSNNGNAYTGCWGVYQFPSGKIAASDMKTGLYVLKVGKSVGINNSNNNIAEGYSLSQNYPNPFNPNTKINYTIPENVRGQTSDVRLVVTDILGNEIATLVNEKQNPGNYSVNFDGSKLSSGVYFYKLSSGEFKEVKKMTLLK